MAAASRLRCVRCVWDDLCTSLRRLEHQTMVRGPRRGNAERRQERALRHTHSVDPGPSILEMLEESLTEACVQYRALATAYSPGTRSASEWCKVKEAQGRIRGIAISVAMMRHPLRRYETAWWGYVKKLEKRHLQFAREQMSDGEEGE